MGTVNSRFYPLCTYADSLALQEHSRSLAKNANEIYLMGFEYYGVITLGRSAESDSEIKDQELQTDSQGDLTIYQTDRGGKATIHSKGQLVIYPILDVRNHFSGVKDYVDFLQEITIQFLQKFGIRAFVKEGLPGVYTDLGKLAFIGIRVEQGVSKHGISINISNECALFDKIRVCGMDSANVCNMADLMPDLHLAPSIEEAFHFWVESFKDNLYHRDSRSLGAVGSAFP